MSNATLALYKKTQSRLGNVGVCLQAYLRPTPVDIADLRPLRPGIRLVKGAYKEAASVALLRKKDIDGAFHGLAVQLAHLAAEGEVRAATATHDVGLLARLQEVAGAASLPKDAYEVQMLYGIRTADQERIAAEGYAMRTLIAYGPAWYPWYIRRLRGAPRQCLVRSAQPLVPEAPPTKRAGDRRRGRRFGSLTGRYPR